MEGGQICITLQMGFLKEHINLDRSMLDLSVIRQRANAFLSRHFPDHKLPMADQMLLFRHSYDTPNMLQLLQLPEQLSNGSVVEVVFSSKNEKPVQPHLVNVQSYYSPTFCDYCCEILVGLTKQGLRCEKCTRNFHKKCAFASHNNCSGWQPQLNRLSDIPPAGSAYSAQNGYRLPHTFVVHTYKKPTVCKHCNNLLVGFVKQGLQCRDCKVNVHRKCVGEVPADCYAIEPMDLQTEMPESPIVKSPMFDVSEGVQQVTMDVDTGDMIPLGRIPGAAGVRPSQKRPQTMSLIEGWMLHFTSSNPTKRRHYWRMDTRAITLYQDDRFLRVHKMIPLSDVLGLRLYEGPPLDEYGPPHCIEIQTSTAVYYVGENMDWYSKSKVPPKIPRRESGVGMISARKWLSAIRQALMPPQGYRAGPSENPDLDKSSALEFSAIYQLFPEDELGSGQFGKVYSGVHRSTSRPVAIKAIEKDRSMSKKWQNQLKNEVSILQKLNHPGIITLEAVFEFSDKIYVVMEKMKADMLEMILTTEDGRLSERTTKFLILQILKALKYLHEQNIAHCDLKPENVLLSSDDTLFPQAKLCDFGYARIIGDNTFRKTVVGTPAYLAPEVLQKKGYNKSLDVWSVGVVIYVTLSGTFPFNEGEEIQDQIQNASFMYPPNPWKNVSKTAIDLISHVLQVKPEERITIDQCLEHAWLLDKVLYDDVRRLEATLNIRYLTTPEDDQKWINAATSEKQ